MIVIFLDSSCRPNVNGGPINFIACSVLLVKTSICCFVSTACTKVDPPPNLKSPAVFVAVGKKSTGFSCEEKRINNGSCTPFPCVADEFAPNPSQPNTITCRSWSDTRTCLAIVGTLVSPEYVLVALSSTALVPKPFVLSQ